MTQQDRELLEQHLYRGMLRIRLVEEAIARRYPEQEMRCPVHLSIGQEAVSAGFALVARDTDYAVSTHRSHAHFLAKGGSLNQLVAELYGRETGCSRGIGGSMHLADKRVGFMGSSAIVGNSIPIGVGLGLSASLDYQDRVSFVFLGDGATEEGVFYEAMNFAALKKLPVVFVVENNSYSVYSDLSVRQPKSRNLVMLSTAMGVEASTHDGNDVTEVYEALLRARKFTLEGRGARLLEFSTYRHLEHCGPNEDDHLDYRPSEIVAQWKKRDPITLFEERHPALLDLRSEIEEEVSRELENAFNQALSSKPLAIELLKELVFSDE